MLALHGGDDDFVAKLEFFEVGLFAGFVFGQLEALGEEVVEDLFLEGLRVGFLVVDPAGELVGVGGGIFGEFDDLFGGFVDGDPVGVHGLDDVVVIVDAARDLAVCAEFGRSEKSESGDGG